MPFFFTVLGVWSFALSDLTFLINRRGRRFGLTHTIGLADGCLIRQNPMKTDHVIWLRTRCRLAAMFARFFSRSRGAATSSRHTHTRSISKSEDETSCQSFSSIPSFTPGRRTRGKVRPKTPSIAPALVSLLLLAWALPWMSLSVSPRLWVEQLFSLPGWSEGPAASLKRDVVHVKVGRQRGVGGGWGTQVGCATRAAGHIDDFPHRPKAAQELAICPI